MATKKTEETKVISFRVSPEFKHRIEQIALSEKRNASQIAQFCIEKGYSELYDKEMSAADQDQ